MTVSYYTDCNYVLYNYGCTYWKIGWKIYTYVSYGRYVYFVA